MPGLDGWRVAERLRHDPATSDIPFVFVAPRPPNGYRDYVRCFELGAVDYFTLPLNPLELASRIRQVLDHVARGDEQKLISERLAEIKAAEEARAH